MCTLNDLTNKRQIYRLLDYYFQVKEIVKHDAVVFKDVKEIIRDSEEIVKEAKQHAKDVGHKGVVGIDTNTLTLHRISFSSARDAT